MPKRCRFHFRTRDGKYVTSLRALDTTAERFGWDALDDGTGINWVIRSTAGSYATTRTVPLKGNWRGGWPMFISTHPSKVSTVKGHCFRFRVGKSTRQEHLLLIAAATQGNWAWMTGLNGRRIDRADWLAAASRSGVS